MRNLIILGMGQYGRVAKETAQAMTGFDRIVFLDDGNVNAVGKLADAENMINEYQAAFVAMGNPLLRKKWMDQLEKWGYELPVLVHPSAVIMPSASLKEGCIAEAHAVVNSNAKVGRGCLICAGVVINHDAVVEDYCQIDCHATVASGSHLSMNSKIACGAVFKD